MATATWRSGGTTLKLTKIESEVMLLAIRVIEAKDIGDLMEEFKGLTEGEQRTQAASLATMENCKRDPFV